MPLSWRTGKRSDLFRPCKGGCRGSEQLDPGEALVGGGEEAFVGGEMPKPGAGVERLQLGQTDTLDFAPRPRWPLDPTAKKPAGKGAK